MLTVIPGAETDALTAMTQLLRRPEWRDSATAPALRDELTARLNATEPYLRLLAVTALPVIYPDPADRASAIASHVDTEDNLDVLDAALHVADHSLAPDRVDSILAAAATSRTAGASITELVTTSDDSELSDLRNTWVVAHLNCTLRGDTPYASTAVRAWFSDPATTEPLFDTAVAALRPAFSFDADGAHRALVFHLLRSAAAALKPSLLATPTNTHAVRAADALVEQLSFACGKSDTNTDAPRPTTEQKTRWFTDAMPVLDDLAVVGHAHSCYELLETLEFLIDEDPLRIFHTIAAAIKEDSHFRYEQLGVDITVRIIDHYLAEHRHIFTTQPQALSELRHILEIFTTVGWPSALNRSYSLGEIFR